MAPGWSAANEAAERTRTIMQLRILKCKGLIVTDITILGSRSDNANSRSTGRKQPRGCSLPTLSNWLPLSSGRYLDRIAGSTHPALGAFTQRHLSTAFHHTSRSHSSTQVLAHCRLVHQRVPNCVSSRAAATEKDLPCTSWRKMLTDRRVW